MEEQRSGGPSCSRCGGTVEIGEVTGGGGLLGFAWFGQLGWISDPEGRRYAETLTKSTFGPGRAAGFRCESCRMVWFEY
jgi:hypothetical protein